MLKNKSFNKIYTLCTTDHANLGDHKITECEQKFLKDKFENPQLIEVTIGQYWNMRDDLINDIKQEDLIILNGGGSVGTLWPRFEAISRDVANLWPGNMKVIFPQSIYFEDSEHGRQELILAKKAYNNPTVVLTCRDVESFEFAKKEFSCKTLLTPDIVLYGDNIESKSFNNQVMLCLRKDLEGTLSEDDKEQIRDTVAKSGYDIVEKDTVLSHNVSPKDREKELAAFFSEIGKSELVITDRLHGMIFCAISGVSCAVLTNSYHKVAGQYRWISDCTNIHFMHDIDELKEFVKSKKWENEEIKYPNLKDKFEPITDVLHRIASMDVDERNATFACETIERVVKLKKDSLISEESFDNMVVDTLANAFLSINDERQMAGIFNAISENGFETSGMFSHVEDYYESNDNVSLVKRVLGLRKGISNSPDYGCMWKYFLEYVSVDSDIKNRVDALQNARSEYLKLNDRERRIVRTFTPEEYKQIAEAILYTPAEHKEKARLAAENSAKIKNLTAQLNEMKSKANALSKKNTTLIRTLDKSMPVSRVDFKLESDGDDGGNSLEFKSMSDEFAMVEMPKWLQDKNAGYSVKAYSGENVIKAVCRGNGRIRIDLRGKDIRDKDNVRIPGWLDYTIFELNGTNLLEKRVSVWHDEVKRIIVDVKDSQEITISYEWRPVDEIIKQKSGK